MIVPDTLTRPTPVLFNLTSYVVDSADHENVEASGRELEDLLKKPALSGIPVLVLGNKNDLPGALNTDELVEHM